jgi:putative methyltransferase (TIGR04325 family)
MAASSGYDSQVILEKTAAALLQVKNGRAAYERDAVLFDEIQYSWPLLAGLMWVAALHQGLLNVLDFGGSLGSSYFQNRLFLNRLPEVRWNIVEQPRYVSAGKRYFEDDHLRFYESIEKCLSETKPNLVLLSGVLQYLERPYDVVKELLTFPSDHVIIIDRTPFWQGPRDRICVQHVPPSVYPASYPTWIFSKRNFFSLIADTSFEILVEFETSDRMNGPVDFTYKGLILVRSVPQPNKLETEH